MITEKEVIYKQLLAEGEEMLMGMYGDLIMSEGYMSEDWKSRITSWLDAKDNV